MPMFQELDLLELLTTTGHGPGVEQMPLHPKIKLDPIPKPFCLEYQTMGKAQTPTNAMDYLKLNYMI
jgi:hypothetical protein